MLWAPGLKSRIEMWSIINGTNAWHTWYTMLNIIWGWVHYGSVSDSTESDYGYVFNWEKQILNQCIMVSALMITSWLGLWIDLVHLTNIWPRNWMLTASSEFGEHMQSLLVLMAGNFSSFLSWTYPSFQLWFNFKKQHHAVRHVFSPFPGGWWNISLILVVFTLGQILPWFK